MGEAREIFEQEVRRFLAAAIERAGGIEVLALDLQAMGFEGKDGPFDPATIRSWRAGRRNPEPALLFALTGRYGLSLDAHALGAELRAEMEERQRQLAALKAVGE